MNECPSRTEFVLFIYTERSIFSVYPCAVFLRVNWESFCAEEWSPEPTPLWRFPRKSTQWGGQGLGLEERHVVGLCPSPHHQLLLPREICLLSVSSYWYHSLRKPFTLVLSSSVINRYIFVAACPDQVYMGKTNSWNGKSGLWAWEGTEGWKGRRVTNQNKLVESIWKEGCVIFSENSLKSPKGFTTCFQKKDYFSSSHGHILLCQSLIRSGTQT